MGQRGKSLHLQPPAATNDHAGGLQPCLQPVPLPTPTTLKAQAHLKVHPRQNSHSADPSKLPPSQESLRQSADPHRAPHPCQGRPLVSPHPSTLTPFLTTPQDSLALHQSTRSRTWAPSPLSHNGHLRHQNASFPLHPGGSRSVPAPTATPRATSTEPQ